MKESMVMFSVSELKIVTAQHVLRESGIESFVMNKKDSAHAGIFGDIELYVEKDDSDRARKILETQEVI